MKKFFYLGLFTALLFVISSCGGASTPGEAAKKYIEYVQNGEYEKFVDGIAFNEKMDAAKVKEEKDALNAIMKEKVSKDIEKKQGIKKIEILSEEVSEDGNTAKVLLKQTYGNGEVKEETSDMIKQDGVWKMNMGK